MKESEKKVSPRTELQQVRDTYDDVIILREKRLDRRGIMGNQICQHFSNQAL